MKNLIALVLAAILLSLPLAAAETANIPMLFYGEASWYGDAYHGRATASGETYDMTMLTAAHRTLPFGTLVRVTNLENDKSVTVRINDRGPFAKDRVIDVSRAAASLLDFHTKGTAKVEIRVVQLGDGTIKAPLKTASAAPSPGKLEEKKSEDKKPGEKNIEEKKIDEFSPQTIDEKKPLEADRHVMVVAPGKPSEQDVSTGPRIIRPEDVRHKKDEQEKIQATGSGRFVIQAGAFLSLDNAENLLRKIQALSLPVYLRQFAGEKLHRVWVGPFETKLDADQQLDRVRQYADQAFVRNRN